MNSRGRVRCGSLLDQIGSCIVARLSVRSSYMRLGRRGCYHPRPPQIRTRRFPASGSSRESFADDVMDAFGAILCHRHSLTEGIYLVSLAIHVVSWTRFAGCMSRPLFLDMVLSSRRLPSLLRVPASLVPRSRRYYEGATTSQLRISGRLFCSLPPPT